MFQRELLFVIALWVMTASLEGTQYITLNNNGIPHR